MVEIKNFDNDIEEAPKKENNKTDFSEGGTISSKIIGNWGIYTHLIGEVGTYCNACPRIDFNENGTAILTYPTNQKEHYNWSISGENLILNYERGERDSPYFENFEYGLVFSNEDGYLGLSISLSEKEKYILGKSGK